jgi:hypothetical protein
MGGSRRRRPRPEQLHAGVGPEGGEHLLALGVGELVQGQFVVVAHEGRPLVLGVHRRAVQQRLDQRPGVLARQGQVHPLHGDEVEEHGQLVAVLAAEEPELVLVREVHLAEQDPVPGPPPQVPTQGPEEVVRLRQIVPGGPLDPPGLQQERDRVDPETADPQLQPEAHDLRDLVADPGVGDVEVRLLTVEAVEVVLPRRLVEGPDAVLGVREDHLGGGVGRRVGAPHVEVPVRVVAGGAGPPEPRVLHRGVVDDEVDDHPHPAVAGGADELDEVAEVTEPGGPRRSSR